MKRLLAKSGDCKKIAFCLIMLLSVIINLFFLYNYYFEVDFEEVYRESYPLYEDMIIWHSTRDESLSNSNYTNEEIFSVNFNDYDLDNYTYIISYGYELTDISVSCSEIKNSNGLYFVPRVIFESERTDTIYIYKTKKINIDYDMHESDRNIYFK